MRDFVRSSEEVGVLGEKKVRERARWAYGTRGRVDLQLSSVRRHNQTRTPESKKNLVWCVYNRKAARSLLGDLSTVGLGWALLSFLLASHFRSALRFAV